MRLVDLGAGTCGPPPSPSGSASRSSSSTLPGAEYQAGLARLQAAARIQTGPVVDALDLLVLRTPVLLGRERDGGLHTGGHYHELGGTA